MKNLLFILLLTHSICNITYSQSGWIIQNGGLNTDLYSVHIIDSNYYITAGNGDTILVSSNGGVTWNKIPSPINDIIGIDFVNNEVGFMTTEYDLLKTTNKGYNWSILQRHSFASAHRSLDFINETTGYICGEDDSPVAYVIKTTDGGFNWDLYWMNDIGSASYIKFFDANNGTSIVCNRLHFTTNGGVNWTNRTTPLFCPNSIYSVNKNIIFGGSYAGSIYQTTNAGINWTQQVTGTTKYIRNLFFVDSTYGYAIGDSGLILRTTNSGTNWIHQSSNTKKNLNDVYFYNKDIGLIVGEDGLILKTTTAGLTFIEPYSSVIPDKFSLSQNYPNPFNPVTKIKYSIPTTQYTILKVFDALGKEVATLVNEKQNAGSYEVEFSGEDLPSGIYFYSIEAGDFIETKRMILLK